MKTILSETCLAIWNALVALLRKQAKITISKVEWNADLVELLIESIWDPTKLFGISVVLVV